MWYPLKAGLNPRVGGGTLIFSYIRRLGSFFWVQIFVFQYFFRVFRKINIFGGYDDFVDIFGGHHKIGLYFVVISMHLGSWSRYRIWDIFFGLPKFQIFFSGCLKFLIFLGVNGRCWARAYVCRKNESTPPPLWGLNTIMVRVSQV